jgi:soluble lytic murein transglycosylase-like protein
MLELLRKAIPALVLSGVLASYCIITGFGLQAVAVPVSSTTEGQQTASLASVNRDSLEQAIGELRLEQRSLSEREAQAEAAEAGHQIMEQIIEYIGYRKALESKLAEEFPRLGSARTAVARHVVDEALKRDVDPWLVYAIIKVESSFRPKVVGKAGEIGLMQVMPATGRMVAQRALNMDEYDAQRLYDPAFNVKVGTTHLHYLLKEYGEVSQALTVYNAGHTSALSSGYARRVLAEYNSYRGAEKPFQVRIAALAD